MIKEEFDRLCTDGQVSGPVAEAAIRHAESELGVVFPTEYREFLSQYGAALVDGAEIYGLPDPARNNPPLWHDVISMTQRLRAWGQLGSENAAFLPISSDGMGVYFFLDTGASPQTKVWAIGPGVNRTISDNLRGFVLDFVEGRVAL